MLSGKGLNSSGRPVHSRHCQDGGDEREGQRHPDGALALALADGEQLNGLGGVEEEFVEPAVSVAQCFDETVLGLRSHCAQGLLLFAHTLDDLAATARGRPGPGKGQYAFLPLRDDRRTQLVQLIGDHALRGEARERISPVKRQLPLRVPVVRPAKVRDVRLIGFISNLANVGYAEEGKC